MKRIVVRINQQTFAFSDEAKCRDSIRGFLHSEARYRKYADHAARCARELQEAMDASLIESAEYVAKRRASKL